MPRFNFNLPPRLLTMGKILSCVVIAGSIGCLLLDLGLIFQHLEIPLPLKTATLLGSLALFFHLLEAIVAVRFHQSQRSSFQVFSHTFWTGTIGLLEVFTSLTAEIPDES